MVDNIRIFPVYFQIVRFANKHALACLCNGNKIGTINCHSFFGFPSFIFCSRCQNWLFSVISTQHGGLYKKEPTVKFYLAIPSRMSWVLSVQLLPPFQSCNRLIKCKYKDASLTFSIFFGAKFLQIPFL